MRVLPNDENRESDDKARSEEEEEEEEEEEDEREEEKEEEEEEEEGWTFIGTDNSSCRLVAVFHCELAILRLRRGWSTETSCEFTVLAFDRALALSACSLILSRPRRMDRKRHANSTE
jgi:hypothetical protein